jgi:hypothetical protein
LTTNPIAGNTPEHPELRDAPNNQDEKRGSTPFTTLVEPTASKCPEHDVDADAAREHFVGFGNGRPQNGQVNRGRFMGAVRKTWERLRGKFFEFEATGKHIDAAIRAAEELGTPVFLATWNYWLLTCQDELRVPGEQYEWRKWPLKHFVDSGALHTHVERVRPFAGLAEDHALVFLVEARKKSEVPISATLGNLACLSSFANRLGSLDDLNDYYEGQELDTFVREVVIPLDAKLQREVAESSAQEVGISGASAPDADHFSSVGSADLAKQPPALERGTCG